MISIAVPIYNRIDIVKKMAKSLYASNLIYPYDVFVYDDCSTEFDIDILKEIFPDAKKIVRHDVNLNADKNMYYMYKDFLTSDNQYFFNADSDLIFSFNWMKCGIDLLKKTDGILSLFNTESHKVIELFDRQLCIKQDLGAAGVLLEKKRIKEIVEKFDEQSVKQFDWQTSKYFNKNKVKLYCVNNSLVQHIGYNGYNSKHCIYDYGKDFIIDTLENGQIINDLLEKYIRYSTSECKKKCIDYKIGNKILQPIRAIKKMI